MQHKLFALSLGLAGFVLAAQAAFADPVLDAAGKLRG